MTEEEKKYNALVLKQMQRDTMWNALMATASVLTFITILTHTLSGKK